MVQENPDVDIITVAGLLVSGGKEGLEQGIRERVKPRSVVTISPTPPWSALEDPAQAIKRAAAMIQEIIARREREVVYEEPRILLVGHSYGAFIALLAACRLRFEKLFKMILIEGPLHPEVRVEPPALLPTLALCASHYRKRPELAREATAALRELGTSKIIIVQGSREDSVVPIEAQVLPGDFHETTFPTDDMEEFSNGNGVGLIVKLDPSLGGRKGGLKTIFPDSYRTHILWDHLKMEAILSIISRSAA